MYRGCTVIILSKMRIQTNLYSIGSFILTLMVFPCIALHLNIEGILLILGQDAEIAR